MTSKFVTALDKAGDFLKEIFTSKTAEVIEQGGLDIAEIAFPAASNVISGVAKSLATAQALAAAAPTEHRLLKSPHLRLQMRSRCFKHTRLLQGQL